MTTQERIPSEISLNGEIVFKGKLLEVHRDQVRLASGHLGTREYIQHSGATVVIPYLGNRELLMIRQYRYPIREEVLELPAGKIDPGENAAQTVQRELQEETGFLARQMIFLTTFYPCVGYSSEILHLFFASNLQPAPRFPDEDEKIENMTLLIEQAITKVFSGEIRDAKTIIGLFWADRLITDRNFRQKHRIDQV